jgi:prepilin-type N-terminal cleavage/methylation domain-containing protein
MLNNSYKNKKGFTLLEVISAIFIISVGVLGIVRFIPSLIVDSSINSSRFTAAYLSQEGVELVRNIRDTNLMEAINKDDSTSWKEGLEECTAGCELDYYCVKIEDPVVSNPISHNCFKAYDSGDLLKLDDLGFYNYSSGEETKFKRKITIIEETTNVLTVSVDVYWQDRGVDYQTSLQEKLYQW